MVLPNHALMNCLSPAHRDNGGGYQFAAGGAALRATLVPSKIFESIRFTGAVHDEDGKLSMPGASRHR